MSFVTAGATYTSSKQSSITIPVNTGVIQANDIVLLMMLGYGGTSNTYTYPSGFNPVSGLANQDVTGDGTQGMAYKVSSGSEPSSYTVSSSATDMQTLIYRVYRGRNTTTPFTATAVTATNYFNTSPVTYSLNGITAAAGDDVVLFICNKYFDGTNAPTYTPPSGYGNQQTAYASVLYSPIITASDYTNFGGGATGSNGGTLTQAGGDTDLGYAAFVFSLAVSTASTALPYWPKQTFVNDYVIQV